MTQGNKIVIKLRRSAIGTTPSQRKNLIGLGLMKTGKYSVLADTASVRGMIRKVIHLVDVAKGDQAPVQNNKPKKGYEVIVGEGQAATKTKKAKTSTGKKTTATKAFKKPVKKTAK